MKRLLFLAPALLLMLSACSSTSSSTAETTQTSPAETAPAPEEEAAPEEGSSPPKIGMTREQVRARYGRPVNVSTNSRGEVWTYVFNNFDGRAFIPYYGAFVQATKQRYSGVIHFDSAGRVRDYNWNQSNPLGASIWR